MKRESRFVGTICAVAIMQLAWAAPETAHPDLSGVWQVASPIKRLRTSRGAAPPLLPVAGKAYAARGASLDARDTSFDPTQTDCQPMGEPRSAYDGMPFQIFQRADEIAMLYQWNRMVRFVPVDSAARAVGPTYYGTSTARWEGPTLVMEVADIHDTTLLDASGLPHSSELHMVERFTLAADGRTLQERITFDDPKMFSRPWDALITYQKRATRISEDVCIERVGLRTY